MFDGLISLIAPHPCYNCGKIGAVLCENCKYNINLEYFDGCIVCGSQTGPAGVCRRCVTSYERAWCVGERSGTLRDLIDGYKFYNNYAAHRELASLLLARIGQLPPATVIVPVPTVSSHIRQRGYDHTLLLARHLAKLQGVEARALLRRRTATKQRGENKHRRLEQAKNAFEAKGILDKDQRYLLLDDVITTGATLQYAARALQIAGATSVWAAVVARQPLD